MSDLVKQVQEGYGPTFERARKVLISANIQQPYIGWFEEFAQRVYADLVRRIKESQ